MANKPVMRTMNYVDKSSLVDYMQKEHEIDREDMESFIDKYNDGLSNDSFHKISNNLIQDAEVYEKELERPEDHFNDHAKNRLFAEISRILASEFANSLSVWVCW